MITANCKGTWHMERLQHDTARAARSSQVCTMAFEGCTLPERPNACAEASMQACRQRQHLPLDVPCATRRDVPHGGARAWSVLAELPRSWRPVVVLAAALPQVRLPDH